MKISVNRNIIETDLIYNITEVVGDPSWKATQYIIVSYSFMIQFYQGKDIVISLHCRDVAAEYNNKKTYIEVTTIVQNRLNALRDNIVKSWNSSKSDIPKFEV